VAASIAGGHRLGALRWRVTGILLLQRRLQRAQSGILLAGFGVVPSPNMYAGTGIRIVPLTASP